MTLLLAFALGQGALVAEPTATSVVLQARLTAGDALVGDDLPGAPGVVCFEVSTDDFETSSRSGWLPAEAANDFLARHTFTGLEPGTRYRYRVVVGAAPESAKPATYGTFRTLPLDGPARFVVVSCLNDWGYQNAKVGKGLRPAAHLGFQAADHVALLDPDFVVFTGDSVYYDAGPHSTEATSMRARWHRLFSRLRMRQLLAKTATFWQLDDHDFRFNDADHTSRSGRRHPSPELGERIFREQLPVPAETFRTFRVGRHTQVWLLESRLHRSPNGMPDGPEKSMWGATQRAWLERTLVESTAKHRVVISPTPLVGPGDAKKRDNHTNHQGFRHEGEAFHRFVAERLPKGSVLLITGDRHWQYHSIHPTGTAELSVGAFSKANARMGRAPGDAKGTDPQRKVVQPFLSPRRDGGFLEVVLEGESLTARLRDTRGRVRHTLRR